METKPNTFIRHSIIYGAYTGGGLILFSLLTYSVDIDFQSPLMYLAFLLLAAGIFMGIKSYRDNFLGGFISYGKCIALGVMISLFASILLAIYSYLFFTFFDTSMIKKILDETEENLVKKGMSDEQIEMAMKYTAKFMQPLWMSAMSILMYTFWGTIISLIIGIFAKKEDPSFEGQFK
jgi:hypothetical protein